MANIHSFPNYKIDEYGVITNIHTGRNLTAVMKNGYLGVRLSRNGKLHYKSVHLLVYESFIGARTRGMHIDHIDGVRTNNHVSNLRELSPEQNNANRLHLVRGEQVNTSKLTESTVMEIRRRKSKGERSRDLAEMFGVSKSSILRIASGKTWSHLPILPVDNSVWADPSKTGALSGKALRRKYGKDYFSRIARSEKVKVHCRTCRCTA